MEPLPFTGRFSCWTLSLASLFVLFSFSACSSQHTQEGSMEHPYTNALVHETSPYLLQHAHNPVDWHPWGEEALEKARKENKLLIISVGYAACHWCHVMEHETFEDSTAAALMNEFFVPIKVDREERPDIDQIYMSAVQLMTGSGGWPLNCIALPDGRPIWGGTYFPKAKWMNALRQLADLWQNDPKEAREYAERLTDGVRAMEDIVPVSEANPFSWDDAEEILRPWRGTFDLKEGGRNRAPKFPLPNNWLFLMRVAHFRDEPRIQEAVDLTLKKMAWGGIYDQLGGGFARYSVDGMWKIPHFEKMTYDNGQLVSLYSEAYLKNPQALYKRTVYQTLEYTAREMTSPEGGFYSSLDADSEGEEGKFYVWKKEEIEAVLGADAEWFCDYYQIKGGHGNWEHGTNVLIIGKSVEEFAQEQGWSTEKLLKKLEEAREKLFAVRAKRIRPGLDDKILTSWNAIMLKGYVDAYRVFGEKDFLKAALKNANFIEDKLRKGNQLFRNYKAGRATINAFLDDYALLADAYIALYQATFDQAWLERAKGLIDYTKEHFYAAEKGMFYYTSDLDPALIARKMEIMDNVIPGANSVLANALFDLGHFFNQPEYRETALQMLQNVKPSMPSYGSGYSNWAILMLKQLEPFHEVVVAGSKAPQMARELDQTYHPNKLLIAAKSESRNQLPLLEQRFVKGETRIYICQDMACQLPVTEVAAALKQLGK